MIDSPCEPLGRKVTLTGEDFQTPCLKSINIATQLMVSNNIVIIIQTKRDLERMSNHNLFTGDG
jgi:hypothetical protein